MKIALFNKKGGVGKTPLSFLIAKELNLHILTNDDSVISKDMVTFQDKIDTKGFENIVIDLGGWIDDNTLDILKECDIVFIPFTSKPNSIKRTKNLIEELKTAGIDFNLILTQYTKQKEIEIVKGEIKEDIEYFLPNTKMLDLLIQFNIDIKEFESYKLYAHVYKNHIKAFKDFITDLQEAM